MDYSGMTEYELRDIFNKLIRAGGKVPTAVAYEIEDELERREAI